MEILFWLVVATLAVYGWAMGNRFVAIALTLLVSWVLLLGVAAQEGFLISGSLAALAVIWAPIVIRHEIRKHRDASFVIPYPTREASAD